MAALAGLRVRGSLPPPFPRPLSFHGRSVMFNDLPSFTAFDRYRLASRALAQLRKVRSTTAPARFRRPLSNVKVRIFLFFISFVVAEGRPRCWSARCSIYLSIYLSFLNKAARALLQECGDELEEGMLL